MRKHRPLDDVWADALHNRGLGTLAPRDRGFARALIATSLRRLGQIDAILETFLDRPLPANAAKVNDLLRIGAAQLVFLDVAPHAGVGETVALVPDQRYRGLVNAVLRKVAERGQEIAQGQDAPRLNTPDWLWDSWAAAYGEDTARAIAAHHLEEPSLDLWVRANPEDWSGRLEARVLPTGTLRRGLADVRTLEGFDEGAWWVQDAAAALPIRLFRKISGQTIYDLCAAPGGKTAQLASLGAHVFAMDRSRNRLARVHENLDRLHLQAELIEMDATQWAPEQPAEAILLDAPCSATGTIRRHPDIAHLKHPQDVTALAAAQDRLLDTAFRHLKTGGTLIYCTCSLQPEEGPERVEHLLADQPAARRMPVDPSEINDFAEAVTPEGDLRTLPCLWSDLGGLDGFYAARITRL